MAKKRGNRIQVILECTEHAASGKPGTLLRTEKMILKEWRLRKLILF
jgi:hypothetical protein